MKLPRMEFLMLAGCAAAALWLLSQQRQAQPAPAGGWVPWYQ